MSGTGNELAIERVMDVPVDVLWDAVTNHLTEWWCPRPWRSEIVALEWKNGGRFAITMKGPDGEVHAGDGMLLEVVPGKSFTFTNLLGEGWTPQQAQPVGIVGKFEFSDAGNGKTNFRSSARHVNAADAEAHDKMGFTHGWGICADQLEEVAKGLVAHA